MDNFDLKKYLAEGRLFKEEVDYSSIKGEMKKIYDIDVDLDTIKDFVTSYDDGEGMDVFDTTEREDFYLYLTEGRLLKEEKGINYLKDAFETYLAGGDTFTNKPGKTETVKFKNDGSLIPKNKFEVALQSLPTTVKVDVYNVNFKKVGDNIVGTFKIK